MTIKARVTRSRPAEPLRYFEIAEHLFLKQSVQKVDMSASADVTSERLTVCRPRAMVTARDSTDADEAP